MTRRAQRPDAWGGRPEITALTHRKSDSGIKGLKDLQFRGIRSLNAQPSSLQRDQRLGRSAFKTTTERDQKLECSVLKATAGRGQKFESLALKAAVSAGVRNLAGP